MHILLRLLEPCSPFPEAGAKIVFDMAGILLVISVRYLFSSLDEARKTSLEYPERLSFTEIWDPKNSPGLKAITALTFGLLLPASKQREAE